MPRTVIVQPGQCIEDIALQEYGSINAVDRIVFDNESLLPEGFSTRLEPGTSLSIRDAALDPVVLSAMRRANVIPATDPGDQGPFTGTGGDHNEDFNNDHNI